MKKNIYLFLLLQVIYLFFAGKFRFSYPATLSNYYNYLAKSFLSGKLYLTTLPLQITDLVYFKNKFFLYWPPAPALLITPFIAIFSLSFSDVLYTSIIGGLNCFIFYLVLLELKKSQLIKSNNKTLFLSTLFFSFGTVHFYLSLFGRIWFSSQIFCLFFLLLSLFLILKFYNTNNIFNLIMSSIFFSLSFLSRNTIIFYIILFFFLILSKRKLKKGLFLFFFVFLPFFLFFLILNFIYNFLRFGSFFENGFKYHLKNPFFYSSSKKYGFFNLVYFGKNFFYNFLNPLEFKTDFPFIKPNPLGNGIFFTSPLFLYLFINFKKLKKTLGNKKKRFLFIVIFLSIIFTISPAMFFFGTGWFQFGARYLLDIIPLLIILLIPCLNDFQNLLSKILLLISIFINIMAFFWWKSLEIL